MDDIDRKLLARLQEDATTPMADLADHVGLSVTPVWKRIQKLEQSGVIKRRVALLDPELVGIGLTVFVAIEAHEHSPDWLASFAAAMTSMPEVMDAYRMAGEVDYMLHAARGRDGHDRVRRLLQALDRCRAAKKRHVALRHGAVEADDVLSASGPRFPRPPRCRSRHGRVLTSTLPR